MKLYFWRLLILSTVLCGCDSRSPVNTTIATKDNLLTSYVDPFIGTGGHGHTYPGATAPFGMMQLSPDTRLDGWDGCSGYHYSDEYIYGFSHTHLSGTGVSDYGDVLLMPATSPILNNGANGKPGYRSRFSHSQEQAAPGYYEVFLEDPQVQVRLTTTQRAGIHEYHFKNKNEEPYIIIDLNHRDELIEHSLEVISPTQIRGKRISKAWATQQILYYYIEFSLPIENWDQDYAGNASVAAFKFNNPTHEPITVKIGISPVDEQGAQKNLEQEIGLLSFNEVKELITQQWEMELSKIIVESKNPDVLTNFYTSLYHTMLAPNLYQDVDGRYRGMDLSVHRDTTFSYHTVFSMWDTYRATHPLYTIIDRERSNDFIKTLLSKYQEGGILPIWDLSSNYTGCMIGYHAAPIIADAYIKGIDNYDHKLALEAVIHSASQDHLGLNAYKKLGFIPVESESESVSKTLEYAYDDWTIAQLAKKMNRLDVYNEYLHRAQNYKNLYNPATGFFQGRVDNTWFSPFKPEEVNFNYTEANAWQYSLYAPQDISGHIELMGGASQYENHLDNMFTATTQTSGRHQADITGLIGQYAHGNEPSHHMAYLYNYVGAPHKTQQYVSQILTTLYQPTPDGISGNEDCGQMSAWYVLSSLGFYPVTPGSTDYIIGSPLMDRATIHLENKHTFTLSRSGKGPYIKKAISYDKDGNKQLHEHSFLTHEQITAGGGIHFEMSEEPQEWGSSKSHRPISQITDATWVSTPFIEKGSIAFTDSTVVHLQSTDPDAQIYYLRDDSTWETYTQPIVLYQAGDLTTMARKGDYKSSAVTTTFYKYDPHRKINLTHQYANEYSAGGNHALIDGRKGGTDFRTGAWQGTQDKNLEFTIDLGTSQSVEKIQMNFLKDQRSWIFYPKQVEIILLDEHQNPLAQDSHRLPVTGKKEVTEIHEVESAFAKARTTNTRYVKIKVTAQGALPEWHLGFPYQGTAWTFMDEIEIK